MVQIHETIFRDAHQSKLATRMRTEDMLPIADKIDQVGYFSFETWGGATFDSTMRFLAEDPWERIKTLKEHLPNTPMQMLERAMNIVAYRNFPDDIVEKFIEFAHRNGVDYFRIFDALNDLRNMSTPIDTAKKVGAHVQGTVCYAVTPVHTVEYYVNKFKELEKMGCDSLCLKDMSGIVSPKRVYTIVHTCKEEGIKIPIDLHCHSTSGMAPLSYLSACEAGVDVIDCALSPISGGTGQPPTESIVSALQDTPYDTGYDLELLMECREFFLKVWDKYKHLHRQKAMMVDPSVTIHQIPGGMLSNLVIQLEEFGAADKYYDVLEEVHNVQRDFGWPTLVTPTSQIVGVQSVMNVVFGRYKRIPEESKNYIRGMYGRAPGEISKEIYKTILGKDWKDEVIDCRPADLLEPEYKKCRDELEELGLLTKEEDVISYAIYPEQAKKLLSGEAKPEFTSEDLPLETTITGRRFKVKLDDGEYEVGVRKV
ncbi:MAG: pyruvate carboxylase subunit B [Halobacteriota archaeon]|nr:pyruvate carboxylase subunit B [Halobacteriota archaeon]